MWVELTCITSRQKLWASTQFIIFPLTPLWSWNHVKKWHICQGSVELWWLWLVELLDGSPWWTWGMNEKFELNCCQLLRFSGCYCMLTWPILMDLMSISTLSALSIHASDLKHHAAWNQEKKGISFTEWFLSAQDNGGLIPKVTLLFNCTNSPMTQEGLLVQHRVQEIKARA